MRLVRTPRRSLLRCCLFSGNYGEHGLHFPWSIFGLHHESYRIPSKQQEGYIGDGKGMLIFFLLFILGNLPVPVGEHFCFCATQAVVQSFQGLGINFDMSQIELVRDPKEQVRTNETV